MAERKKSTCKIGKGSERMPDTNIPPYTMTDEIMNLVIEIIVLSLFIRLWQLSRIH